MVVFIFEKKQNVSSGFLYTLADRIQTWIILSVTKKKIQLQRLLKKKLKVFDGLVKIIYKSLSSFFFISYA